MVRGGGKIKVSKSALVPYPAAAMYDLVADVERYPGFLPWCRKTTTEPSGEDLVDARLEIARGPLHLHFTTRNTMRPPEAIELRLLDGPFRHLEGFWRFAPIGDQGCRVSLDLEFEFSSVLLRRVLNPLFSELANSMLNAFCHRAREVYGGH